MSNIGGLSIPIIRRAMEGEMFVLTHYRDPVAILTTFQDVDVARLNLDTLDHLRFLKKETRDILWSGETIAVTLVRDPEPVAYLIPLERPTSGS